MRLLVAVFILASLSLANAKDIDQGAGNITDEYINELLKSCNNSSAIMLRAKIRLQTERNSAEVSRLAKQKMTEGFEACSQGDEEKAISLLNEALSIAEGGTDEYYGVDDTDVAKAVEGKGKLIPGTVKDAAETASSEGADDQLKPWWKFW